MPAAVNVTWLRYLSSCFRTALLAVAVSSIQFEVCLNKNQDVFNLRLSTHVHQISVAITHGRWNRKRIGPRKYETGKALPRYRRLDLAAEVDRVFL